MGSALAAGQGVEKFYDATNTNGLKNLLEGYGNHPMLAADIVVPKKEKMDNKADNNIEIKGTKGLSSKGTYKVDTSKYDINTDFITINDSANLTIEKDVTISNSNVSHEGAMIYVGGTGTLSLTSNCKLTGWNSSKGAVHVAKGAKFTVSGSPVVNGNNSVNVYLESGAKITVGNMEQGAKIGVTLATGTGIFTEPKSSFMHEYNYDYFVSDDPKYKVSIGGTQDSYYLELVLVPKPTSPTTPTTPEPYIPPEFWISLISNTVDYDGQPHGLEYLCKLPDGAPEVTLTYYPGAVTNAPLPGEPVDPGTYIVKGVSGDVVSNYAMLTIRPSDYTPAPTAEPTTTPTAEPTATPTIEPTTTPIIEPTTTPTAEPTATPTIEPTAIPPIKPTEVPTAEPTVKPTATPAPTHMYHMYSINTFIHNNLPLNIRDMPSLEGKVIGKVPVGERIEVIQYGEEWTYGTYKGITGYMATLYLRFGTEEELDAFIMENMDALLAANPDYALTHKITTADPAPNPDPDPETPVEQPAPDEVLEFDTLDEDIFE